MQSIPSRLAEPQHVQFALDATSAYIEYPDFDNGTKWADYFGRLASHGQFESSKIHYYPVALPNELYCVFLP